MVMEKILSDGFLHVVEQAAIASAYSIGNGDPKNSDRLAVESMRSTMGELPIDGNIVIGEGERDEAPMLYIGETVGRGKGYLCVDIAVDPLEGTNLCATGTSNAITVLAASERGGLLHAPDIYMQKLCVGPTAKGKVHIDASPAENLNIIAKSLKRHISNITVVVLDRPRHSKLIDDIRCAGARIRIIGDGDLSAALCAAISGTEIHAVMGIGGAPEGVITAAALKCLGGEIQCRMLVDSNTASREKAEQMGVDFGRIYKTDDLAPGNHIIFAACGVTSGNLLKGVHIIGDNIKTSSIVLNRNPHRVRFVDTIHINNGHEITLNL
jgi:fructose-1,6-bisphosphatase class II